MKRPTPHALPVVLTPTMDAFLAHQVRAGMALEPDELIRFLIVQEIRRWEKLHHRPFNRTE
jgi:hypothetical protein